MNFKESFGKAKGAVVSKVEGAVSMITGQAVIQDVAKFAQETDAINTAIVTRIYELIEQNKLLRGRHEKTRKLVVLSLVLNCALMCAVIMLFARLK
jgi:hypothetical protein